MKQRRNNKHHPCTMCMGFCGCKTNLQAICYKIRAFIQHLVFECDMDPFESRFCHPIIELKDFLRIVLHCYYYSCLLLPKNFLHANYIAN